MRNFLLPALTIFLATPSYGEVKVQRLTATNSVNLRVEDPELLLEVNYPRVTGVCGIEIRADHGSPHNIRIGEFQKLIRVEEVYNQGIAVQPSSARTLKIAFQQSGYKAVVRLATKNGQSLQTALGSVFGDVSSIGAVALSCP